MDEGWIGGMRMLNEFGMRGISLRLDLPFLRSQGLPGERATVWARIRAGRGGTGETALTCASLRLLQLQKLLQEAAIVGKLVGNGRVVCVGNSRPMTEDRKDEPWAEGPSMPQLSWPHTHPNSHLLGPQTSLQSNLHSSKVGEILF